MNLPGWFRIGMLLLCWQPVQAALPLAVGSGSQPLRGHLEAWKDGAGTAGIGQVTLDHPRDFRPLAGNAVFGYRRGAVWLRF